jgi:hypothetical protein
MRGMFILVFILLSIKIVFFEGGGLEITGKCGPEFKFPSHVNLDAM